MIRPLRRRAEPDVEIETGRRRFGALGADRPPRLAAIAFRHQQLAVLARLQGRDLAGPVQAAALLRAVLHDAAMLGGGLDALAAFEDVVADRLLDVHVLARLAGPDRDQRVPVIAGGHRHGVEILVIERRANVDDALRLVAAQLLDGRPPRGEQPRVGVDDVGDRDVVVFQLAGKGLDVRLSPAVDARHSHAHRFVGAQHFARRFRAGNREQAESRARGGRSLDEPSAGNSGHGGDAPKKLWKAGKSARQLKAGP